jgi:hypothetical protein
LWRKSLEADTWKNQNLWRLWTWCLLKATHCNMVQMVGYQEVSLEPGQFIFGRMKASQETGLSEQQIRTTLDSLRKRQNLTIKSTSKYSVISIVKWEEYQSESTNNLPSQQPAINQQITTNKHNKNNKNNKNTYIDGANKEIIELFNNLCPSLRKVTRLTDARQKKISARLKEHSLEDLKNAFAKLEASDFLSGRKPSNKNPNWKAGFDWLFENDTNIVKVLEGNYDNGKNQVRGEIPDYSNYKAPE